MLGVYAGSGSTVCNTGWSPGQHPPHVGNLLATSVWKNPTFLAPYGRNMSLPFLGRSGRATQQRAWFLASPALSGTRSPVVTPVPIPFQSTASEVFSVLYGGE